MLTRKVPPTPEPEQGRLGDSDDETRQFAATSLAQLLTKESSAAAGVRAVLHIATLRSDAWWQTWAYLQLSDLKVGKEGVHGARQMLDDAFGEGSRERDSVLDDVWDDLMVSRQFVTADLFHATSIDQIESDLRILDSRLSAGDAERGLQTDHAWMVRITAHLKNRAQTYLTAIKSGLPLPIPGSPRIVVVQPR